MTKRTPTRTRKHVDPEETGSDGNTDFEFEDSSASCVRNLERGFVCVIGGREELEEIIEGSKRHITDMLEYEAETTGEPEKWDALDEALQQHVTPLEDTLPTEV